MLFYSQFVRALFGLKGVALIGRIRECELELRILSRHLLFFLSILHRHSMADYRLIVDVAGVDRLQPAARFVLAYSLLSVRFNQRIRLLVFTDTLTPVPSIALAFCGANWMEREVWDLFGIGFFGHPDLRRILTDYGFTGHPLCKDFPLTGFFDLYYDELQQRLFYERLVLFQKLRLFDFKQPWG